MLPQHYSQCHITIIWKFPLVKCHFFERFKIRSALHFILPFCYRRSCATHMIYPLKTLSVVPVMQQKQHYSCTLVMVLCQGVSNSSLYLPTSLCNSKNFQLKQLRWASQQPCTIGTVRIIVFILQMRKQAQKHSMLCPKLHSIFGNRVRTEHRLANV